MENIIAKFKTLQPAYQIVCIVLLTSLVWIFITSIIVNDASPTQSQEEVTTKQALTDTVPNTTTANSGVAYDVVKVVDGDTIDVSIDGKVERLRLIGINTPETVDPRKPVECFGVEASNKTKTQLTGKKVFLENDTTQDERDKYNRLLRYVFLEDGTNFNLLMIKEGYAYEYTYSLPYKYQSEFKEAQIKASEEKNGLWGSVCNGSTTQSTSTAELSVPTGISPSVNSVPTPTNTAYECSSNTYNCSDFSTHNEAQKVYLACGGISNDIHRLDRDGDGSVCETLP